MGKRTETITTILGMAMIAVSFSIGVTLGEGIARSNLIEDCNQKGQVVIDISKSHYTITCKREARG